MTWQDLKTVARCTYEKSRDATYDKLQKRRQELAKEREDNKDNVPFQIGRVFAWVLIFGVPLAVVFWLIGAF